MRSQIQEFVKNCSTYQMLINLNKIKKPLLNHEIPYIITIYMLPHSYEVSVGMLVWQDVIRKIVISQLNCTHNGLR